MIDLEDGTVALDLFAGTGAITWELVSRGCSRVTSVEQAPVQCRFIAEVKNKLGDDVDDIDSRRCFQIYKNCENAL